MARSFAPAGMTPEAAHYAASREFGGVAQTGRLPDRRGLPWIESALRDARYPCAFCGAVRIYGGSVLSHGDRSAPTLRSSRCFHALLQRMLPVAGRKSWCRLSSRRMGTRFTSCGCTRISVSELSLSGRGRARRVDNVRCGRAASDRLESAQRDSSRATTSACSAFGRDRELFTETTIARPRRIPGCTPPTIFANRFASDPAWSAVS